jgi:WD40 repeat protein
MRVGEVGVAVWALSRSSCSRFVAAGCDETGLVNLFRLPDWNPVWSAKAHDGIVAAVSWSPDDRFLATASFDGEVKMISADTGATLRTLGRHKDMVFSALFSHDGAKALSGSMDKTAQTWRIFPAMERRVRGLVGGWEVLEGDWEIKEVCCEIVARMKRLWEVEE